MYESLQNKKSSAKSKSAAATKAVMKTKPAAKTCSPAESKGRKSSPKQQGLNNQVTDDVSTEFSAEQSMSKLKSPPEQLVSDKNKTDDSVTELSTQPSSTSTKEKPACDVGRSVGVSVLYPQSESNHDTHLASSHYLSAIDCSPIARHPV